MMRKICNPRAMSNSRGPAAEGVAHEIFETDLMGVVLDFCFRQILENGNFEKKHPTGGTKGPLPWDPLGSQGFPSHEGSGIQNRNPKFRKRPTTDEQRLRNNCQQFSKHMPTFSAQMPSPNSQGASTYLGESKEIKNICFL